MSSGGFRSLCGSWRALYVRMTELADLCNCKDSWIVFWYLIGLLTASTNARSVVDVLYHWRVWLCESRPVVWFYILRRLQRWYYMLMSLFRRLLLPSVSVPLRLQHQYGLQVIFRTAGHNVSQYRTACALWPICMPMPSSYLLPTFPLPNLSLPILMWPTLLTPLKMVAEFSVVEYSGCPVYRCPVFRCPLYRCLVYRESLAASVIISVD